MEDSVNALARPSAREMEPTVQDSKETTRRSVAATRQSVAATRQSGKSPEAQSEHPLSVIPEVVVTEQPPDQVMPPTPEPSVLADIAPTTSECDQDPQREGQSEEQRDQRDDERERAKMLDGKLNLHLKKAR